MWLQTNSLMWRNCCVYNLAFEGLSVSATCIAYSFHVPCSSVRQHEPIWCACLLNSQPSERSSSVYLSDSWSIEIQSCAIDEAVRADLFESSLARGQHKSSAHLTIDVSIVLDIFLVVRNNLLLTSRSHFNMAELNQKVQEAFEKQFNLPIQLISSDAIANS